MITNERQYKITKAALAKLQGAIKASSSEEGKKSFKNPKLAKAQLEALESEREALLNQINEYEILRSGAVGDFRTESLAELPDLLVKARIAKGMSQRQLAEKLGLKEQQIQRYESEKYATASLWRLIEVADALMLRVAKHARLQVDAPRKNSTHAQLDWSRFPLAEMYRRGWFAGFAGSLVDAKTQAQDLLASYFSAVGLSSSTALYRKHVRAGSTLDDYALLAWESRILWLAQIENPEISFAVSKLTDEWFRGLVHLSASGEGAARAKSYLRNVGIALVIEPHLPRTYLDGAALMLSPTHPVIGMTLRYDRLDNFWFVLLHEIAHLRLHFQGSDFRQFFDDLDAAGDDLEAQADQFAAETLVPKAIWETAAARYVRTRESVKNLARQLRISPAIVAGKIQKEADNYVILKDLIGIGEVRRQFPEAKYGQ